MQLYNALYTDQSGNVTLRTSNGGGSGDASIADSLVIDSTGNYWFAVVEISTTPTPTITYINLATGSVGTPVPPIKPVATDNTVQTVETAYDAIAVRVGSNRWQSIANSADGVKLVAVANSGYIYTSPDSGVTWLEQRGMPVRNWWAVSSSADGMQLAAVVNNGYIYLSADGGATWNPSVSAGNRAWVAIASSSDGIKLAAAVSGGFIYTSTNGGSTWTERTTVTANNWVSIASSSDGVKLVAVINGGNIYTSADSGATWTIRLGAGSKSWQSIASSSDGTKLAVVVSDGFIYTSIDSGVTWAEQTSSGSRAWDSIATSSDGAKLVAVVNSGSIYTSTDSGVTWTDRISAGNRIWNYVTSSSNGNKLVAVVNGGSIYTSTDSGVTWTVQERKDFIIGDVLLSVVLLDSHTTPPTVISSCWVNVRTQLIIPEPAQSDIVKSTQNVRVTGSVAITGGTVNVGNPVSLGTLVNEYLNQGSINGKIGPWSVLSQSETGFVITGVSSIVGTSIKPQVSVDNGVNWFNTYFRGYDGSITDELTNDKIVLGAYRGIICPSGTQLVRLIMTTYGSGSFNVVTTSNYIGGNTNLSVSVVNSTTQPPAVQQVGSWDGSILRPFNVDTMGRINIGTISNPSIIVSDRYITTLSAVNLPARALVNGIILTADVGNVGNVWVGGNNGISTTNSYPLQPGQSIAYGITNTNALWVLGTTTTDILYITGN